MSCDNNQTGPLVAGGTDRFAAFYIDKNSVIFSTTVIPNCVKSERKEQATLKHLTFIIFLCKRCFVQVYSTYLLLLD